MSIALSIKINDGLVLAADSASTILGQNTVTNQTQVMNTYNNANKIFNLVKNRPIGVVTWGVGGIGPTSMATLIKDLRRKMTPSRNVSSTEWTLPDNFDVQGVANLVRRFIYEENYISAFKDWPQKPDVSLIVAGYSSGASMPDEFQISVRNGECDEPTLLRQNKDTGATWGGIVEPLNRLLLGIPGSLPLAFEKVMKLPAAQSLELVKAMQAITQFQLVMPAMPLQDAIDLAEFLIDLTINWVRFAPGAPTVAGPIEIAAISKHEGFRWIRRKHYFSMEFNPEARHG